MEINKNLSSARRIFTLPIETKKFQKNCVGCRCRTNLKFSNRYNLPPNGARESKMPPFGSKSKTTSNCILRFFREKWPPTLFSFYHFFCQGSSIISKYYLIINNCEIIFSVKILSSGSIRRVSYWRQRLQNRT